MQNICIKARNGVFQAAKKAAQFLKRHYRGILYYGAVALALSVLAMAAEGYRNGRNSGQPMVLTDETVQDVMAESGSRIFYPEGMRLIRAYSENTVWNKEMGQWETHAANDYALPDDEIICLAGGKVASVGEDSIRGGYIEIQGEDGKTYLYAGIQPDAGILPGDEIAHGDKIGMADSSMPSEMTMGRHLHLEVRDGEKTVDFERIYAQNEFYPD